MNYDRLFSFVTFSETLNFTRAAELLHISQPALHAQVRKLGETVGAPLYTRDGRSLVLTPEGERIAAYARMVKRQEREMLSELGGRSAGPVVLAAGQGAFLFLLGAAIRKFPKHQWPLRLLTLPGPEAVAAVRNATAQLAVAVLDRVPHDLDATALRSVGQVAVMRRTHPLARKRKLSPADLHGQTLVAAPVGSPHRAMIEQAMRTEQAVIDVGVEATGWQLMLEFARDGMGIAVVNDFCPTPRGCVAMPMRGMPKAAYYVVARSTLNKSAKAMRRLIMETAR